MFALRHTGTKQLCVFSVSSNHDHDFCSSVSYTLDDGSYGDRIWVVPTRKAAEYVRDNSTEWYNADYDTPEHKMVGQLEVVELGIIEK